jgi:phenylacetate-CoA ligase
MAVGQEVCPVRAFLKTFLPKILGPLWDPAKILYDMVPLPVRYGRAYSEAVSLLDASERWDLEKLVGYQENMLRRLVRHCYANVPYYRKVFLEAGIRPDDIATISDLEKLPFLTKAIVREHKRELLATNFSYLSAQPDSTSGSTGAPLDFYVDNVTRAMEVALAFRHLEWLDYRDGDRIAEIKEDSFVDPDRLYWYFPGSRRLKFSFFRIDDSRLEQTAQALERFKPMFIKAFPSSLFILSRWMERHNKRIQAPKYIITSSETLYPSTRDLAERIFKAPVIDWYGQNEKVATAFQCKIGRKYHIQMEQAIVELIPSKTGSLEIVGTSLHAFGMPFVRYRTGDTAVREDQPCPCGMTHPVLSGLMGREGEFIITPEKQIITPTAMDYAIYHLEEIKESQIIQEDINTLRIKVAPWEIISESTKERLLKEIRGYLGSPGMNLIWDEVEEIPRTSRRKKPFVISYLNVEDYI